MINNKWMENPVLSDISTEKMEILTKILNGAGDAAYSMINGLMEITGRVGFAKPLTMIPEIGMWGVFLTTGLTWTLVSVVSMHRYSRGKWKNKGIIKH